MEVQLFPPGTIPECATAEWYSTRATAPHIDQPGHRERIVEAARMVHRAFGMGANSAVDLGAGDGGLLTYLSGANKVVWGYDLQPTNVAAARLKRHVNVMFHDVVNKFDEVLWADCVIATEILEHLVDPHGFVAKIPSRVKFLVASSPHTETENNHYEFHLWAWDAEGYAKMLADNGWKVVEQSTRTMSQVVLAERPW
jgi:2-polyprenyl-3-methyl-5-hydroxy-6-metoxy-1,4-benzoquinol methylase